MEVLVVVVGVSIVVLVSGRLVEPGVTCIGCRWNSWPDSAFHSQAECCGVTAAWFT